MSLHVLSVPFQGQTPRTPHTFTKGDNAEPNQDGSIHKHAELTKEGTNLKAEVGKRCSRASKSSENPSTQPTVIFVITRTFANATTRVRVTLYFLCDSELSYLIVNYNISLLAFTPN
jgi:hypothetical protein